MIYLYLIITLIIGITIGGYFTKRNIVSPVSEQSKKKVENKEKILEFLRENEKVVNNDVEELLGVSDATATRYLDELEKENKVEQVGVTGNAVYYVLK